MPDDLPTIKVHPDFDSFSSEELRTHIRSLEEQVNFGQVHGAEHLVIVSLIQERRSAQAELARRNGTRPPSQQPEFWPELLSAKEALELPPDPTRWIWEDCLPCGGCSVLVAKPKVGKSTLAANLALAVARHIPFLNRGVTQGTVAYFSLDASMSEILELLCRFGFKDSDPIFIHAGRAPDKAVEWIREKVIKCSAKLVVIDTLQRLFRFQNVNDYSEVTNAIEPLLDLAREQNCHLLVTHHARKDSADDLDSAIGSTAIRGMAYSYLHLKKLQDSPQRIFRTDQRAGRNFEEIAISNPDSGDWIEKIGTKEEAEISLAMKAIKEHLEEEPGSTQSQLKEAIAMRKRIIGKAKSMLVKYGEIEFTGEGKKGSPQRFYLAGQLVETREEKQSDANVVDLFKGSERGH